MLPKMNRLSKKTDFDRVYKRGQRIKIDNLLFSFLKTSNEASRLGFVVSKKVSTKATGRNYLKRLMQVAMADLPSSLEISYDMIISLLSDPENQPVGPLKRFVDIKSELIRRLR